MNLKRVELLGFKSFAKKTVLDFESSITAVVGPNGSGKSNVAEALRWALGEQSLKSLRGKRGEDLIFNGSAGYSKLNHASVLVVFDNKERKFNLEFDEVAISRHIYRDGTNEYYINGSKVRLKDVIELLSAVSLGVSSHHIISQGEADRILNANIFERREMIEDALGLKVYQYKKEESEKKLQKTKENIKEVESLRREIAPHLRFLRKQIEQVKKAEEMRLELINLYKEYFKREDNYLNNFRADILKNRTLPEEQIKNIDAETARLSQMLAEVNVLPKESSDKMKDLEVNLLEIRNKKTNLEREIGRLDALIEIKCDMERGNHNKNIKVNDKGEKVCSYCGQVVVKTLDESREDELRKEREREVSELRTKRGEFEKMIVSLCESESRVGGEISSIKSGLENKKDEFRDSERALYLLRAEKSEILAQLNAVRAKEEKLLLEEGAFKMELTEAVVLAGREAVNYKDFGGIETQIDNEPRIMQEERRRKIERIKIRLEDMGNAGEDVLKEYNETEEREKFLEKEVADLVDSAEGLRSLMLELSEKIDIEFKKGLEKINKQFQEFFVSMFGGGSAELTLNFPEKKKTTEERLFEENAENPKSENFMEKDEKKPEAGIDINVNLPRKKIKGLTMLSGGERALTSIALLFAVSQVNPPPFLVLDETDAALDESNSKKYGDMLENLSKISQLIVVTHNRETMSRAGILYGVTMGGDGVSKLLSIKFDEAVTIAK